MGHFVQVTGLGFGVQITAVLYSLVAGYRAALRRDIRKHQQHVIRMIGLAYGVFPFKQIFTALPFLNYMPGEWTYATSVWLSSITGMILTERALLGLQPEDKKRIHTD